MDFTRTKTPGDRTTGVRVTTAGMDDPTPHASSKFRPQANSASGVQPNVNMLSSVHRVTPSLPGMGVGVVTMLVWPGPSWPYECTISSMLLAATRRGSGTTPS